ncbi:MAG: methionine adenosyltransferase [Candidatus Faecousia sp.]|nr:methionine adenosyltransferase [Bacillota bacterium]MDY4220164.1 methionine adenosyltransferase [Candidatus Faecousia sp.]
MEKRLFTSECVTTGHPDKVADRISDSILDACLAQDPDARVACETLVTTDFCCISGEITTTASVDYEAIARQTIREIGYTHPGDGFDAESVEILCRIHTQSPDIALGTNDQVGGAGDQGMMFGGACNQTPELMPLAGAIARALTNRLTQMVAENPLLRPDGKAQVTVEFDQAGNPIGVETVVVSIMHSAAFEIEQLRQYIRELVIAPVLSSYGFDIRDVCNIFINPTGKFVVGGPAGDTGLTGRKIIVDTYGGYFCHGGGAFSGKDPTKVDRSAAYMARYMAKNLVAAGLCDRVQVELAYAIGVAEPVSVLVDTYGTGKVPDERLTELLRREFDLTPAGIIRTLDLRRPIYAETAAKGHFGITQGRPWERTDRVEALLAAVNG